MSTNQTRCGVCGEGVLTTQIRNREIEYKNATLFARQESKVCSECGASPISNEEIKLNRRAIIVAKKQYDNLLTGVEIRALRSQLNLTQERAAFLFGGGPVAFSKYENDDVIQSESMDTLLRLVAEQRLCFEQLKYMKEGGRKLQNTICANNYDRTPNKTTMSVPVIVSRPTLRKLDGESIIENTAHKYEYQEQERKSA